MTALNEVYVPGVFGDLFDVVYAYPDACRWRTIDSYPVVIAAGEIELTAAGGAAAGAVRRATAGRCWSPTRI